MNLHKTLAIVGAVVASACATTTPSHAQSGLGIPILMVADDSDPNSVKRSSDVMTRTVSEFQEQFNRGDWRVMDEHFIAGKKGWNVQDRRPREQLAGLVDLACQDGDDTLCPRAMVLVKIRAFAEPYGGATRIRVRASGDVFDQATNRFLGSWEAPMKVFGGPANCSGACAEEYAGEQARELAISIGTVLREKLKPYNDAEINGTSSARSFAPVGASASGDQGLLNQYLFHFKNFTVEELQVFKASFEEYPKFQKFGGVNGPAENRRYNYMSYAPISDIYEWVEVTVQQLDYGPGSVHVTVENNRTIIIDKIR